MNVNTLSKIPALEKALHSGKVNIILVFADWCGACHRFRKNIWDPMLNSNATHNRIAVRDDMVSKTSLANSKFDYLPSLLVVDEKGTVQTFRTPEGKDTNAMPTPKNLKDMNRIVNVPVKPMAGPTLNELQNRAPLANVRGQANVAVRKNAAAPLAETVANVNKYNTMPSEEPIAAPVAPAPAPGRINRLANTIAQNVKYNVPKMRNVPAAVEANIKAFNKKLNDQLTGSEPVLEKDIAINEKEPLELVETKPLATPQGTVYVPVRTAAPPAAAQKGGGGALFGFLQGLPAAILGASAVAMRGGRKTRRRSRRSRHSRS